MTSSSRLLPHRLLPHRLLPHRSRWHRSVALLVGVSLAGGTAGVATSSRASAGAVSTSARFISRSRCAANKAAGPITYLTGFEYFATVGTIDPVAAQAQGYFKDLCLDVSIKPGTGNPSPAAQAVASGTATLAEVGGASDVVTTNANGIATDAVALYGNTNATVLITMAKTTSLRQLQGKTLGYKSAMPPQITAMLDRAGVDVAKVKEVGVGFDPTILPRNMVQALTGYKSSEVPTLVSNKDKIKVWDPGTFGIKGTFNSLVANPGFARAHPTAVEDFLRATFEAFAHCKANIGRCLSDLATLATPGFDTAANKARWTVESALVDDNLLPGKGLGAETVAQYTPEYKLLLGDKLIPKTVDLSKVVTPRFVDSIEHNGKLVWPAP